MHPEIMEAIERVGLGKKWTDEGRKDGDDGARLNIARKMFLNGESLEKITNYTEIPIDRLKQVLYHQ